MKASLIRMLANGVVRRPHVTTAMPFPEYPVSYNPSLARKKREMMDKCTNDLLVRLYPLFSFFHILSPRLPLPSLRNSFRSLNLTDYQKLSTRSSR